MLFRSIKKKTYSAGRARSSPDYYHCSPCQTTLPAPCAGCPWADRFLLVQRHCFIKPPFTFSPAHRFLFPPLVKTLVGLIGVLNSDAVQLTLNFLDRTTTMVSPSYLICTRLDPRLTAPTRPPSCMWNPYIDLCSNGGWSNAEGSRHSGRVRCRSTNIQY